MHYQGGFIIYYLCGIDTYFKGMYLLRRDEGFCTKITLCLRQAILIFDGVNSITSPLVSESLPLTQTVY